MTEQVPGTGYSRAIAKYQAQRTKLQTRMNAIAPATPTMPAASGDGLFAAYAPPAAGYDEMLSAPGTLRSHWVDFARRFGSMGRQDISDRWRQAQRIIEENGITYSPWGESALPFTAASTWPLASRAKT